MIFTSCNKYDNAIADIESRLDNIEGTTINSLNEQIAEMKSSISDLEHVDYILSDAIFKLGIEIGDLEDELAANATADAHTKKALQAEIENINTLIAALQTKNTELDQKITDLKTYVDNQNSSIKDWANGTFATLEQYSAMQTELAALKALIETYKTDITATFTKKIEDAISASENSIKEWVNGLLAEGYYNIAEIDAKLSTLQAQLADADSDLEKAITEQQDALEQAKTDLTAAYQSAIKEAIEDNNGVINKAVSDAVKKAIDSVEAKLSTIEDKVGNIQKDLKELQNNFTNRIQSFIFLPQYSDNKVKMDYTTGSTEIDLLVSPRELVKFISISHLSAYVRLTENPEVRAVSTELIMNVEILGKSDEGVLTIKVQDTGNTLPDAFWDGSKGAYIYVQINDGNNQIISQAIPMLAHSYVAGNNNINGFGDGEDFNGTVYEN